MCTAVLYAIQHPPVGSPAEEQFFMGAGLQNFPLPYDKDPIRHADGGHAVGDEETGAPLHGVKHRLLDALFGGDVHAAGGLIQWPAAAADPG